MSICIQGMGWVTPLGSGLDDVWQALLRGDRAEPRELTRADSLRKHFYLAVPPKLVESLGRNPRLRRSSSISYFAAAAGLAALENVGLKMTPELAERTAVVFAISSGGVIYTRKFYDQIVKQGANAASPLLFPETVYNAPASHLAALLGITGMTYTLVGDGSVGLAALKFAEQLFVTTDIQQCVVIGVEEVDWVLCEAYRTWRLTSATENGTLLAEGAGALVLAREGKFALPHIHSGVSFVKQTQATSALQKVLSDLARSGTADAVIACANGTFIDRAEAKALVANFPHAPVYAPARALGCALGAGAIWQTILAARALETGGLPGQPHGEIKRVLVSYAGWNQQASGLIIGL